MSEDSRTAAVSISAPPLPTATALPIWSPCKSYEPPFGAQTREWVDSIIVAASAFGVADMLLVPGLSFGIGAALWIAALLAVVTRVARHHETGLARATKVYLLGAAVFAMCLAWRASSHLHIADALAIGVCLALAVGSAYEGSSARFMAPFMGLLNRGLFAIREISLTPRTFYFHDRHERTPGRLPRADVSPIGRGLAISAVLLAFFGTLFFRADDRFASLIIRMLPGAGTGNLVVQHVLSMCAAAAIAGLLLTAITRRRHWERGEPAALISARPVENPVTVEVLMPLYAVIGLFALFVGMQANYFFGGDALVRAPGGPTYAGYATKGVYELIMAISVALPLLFVADWRFKRDSRGFAAFQVGNGAMLILLLLVVVSVFQRISIYVQAYGLSHVRFYSTVFVIWLAFLCVYCAITVLRGRRDLFPAGALAAAFGLLLVTHAVNPDALIARANIQGRFGGARTTDVDFLNTLSLDALPVLTVNGFYDSVVHGARAQLSATPWSSWTYAHVRAALIVGRYDD